MNALVRSVRTRRLLSSLAVLENPSLVQPKIHQTLDTSQYFDCYGNSRNFTLHNTKTVHAHFVRTNGLPSDLFLLNCLLDWYCKSSAMENALNVFDRITHPNVISWNIMISGYTRNSQFDLSCRIFCRMHSSSFEPNEVTYASVLSACKTLQSPLFAMQVYSLAARKGLSSSGHVRAPLIDLFARNCCFEDALKVFNDVECYNVVCWNAIISGAVKIGEHLLALNLYERMCGRYLLPNTHTLSTVLTACATLEELEIGKQVQGQAIKCGAKDIFVGTAIVDLYSKCGDTSEAMKEFLRMPTRNVVSWTAVISGFVKKGDSVSALQLFKRMRKLNEEINVYTITSIITSCAKPDMFKEGTQLHSWILKTEFYTDPVVKASIISMYSKIGAVDYCDVVFREVQNIKNLRSCAVMMSSFAQNQCSEKAITLFQSALDGNLRPDNYCCSSVLSVVDCLTLGRQIHCYIIKTGLVFHLSVANSLFTMYSKCGSLNNSREVFDQVRLKDNVAWASMIAGYIQHGRVDVAFLLFRQMLSEESKPDETTLTIILNGCSTVKSLLTGREIHGYALRAGFAGFDKETVVSGALVNMYSKCAALDSARSVFEMLRIKDEVAYSSLISGYAQNGLPKEAFSIFREMMMSHLKIDSFTISSVLGVTALLNRSNVGSHIHAYAIKIGVDSEVSVGSSLVTMYSKCGSIEECRKSFDNIDEPDLISWTAMIVSYAQHGKGAEALKVYEVMRKQGIRPDSVTLVGVLSACSHNGLVEEGYFYFDSMTREYGLEPSQRHYACMVDILGRAGKLKEAEEFIRNIPIKADALIWGSLLAACKVHGDIELGRVSAKKVMELEPEAGGAYVSLSNICADVGQWQEVLRLRNLMKGTTREPGWSST